MPSWWLTNLNGHELSTWFPFDYFRHYNLLEFKSPTDPLTPDEYKRVIARAYLFLAEVGENNLQEVTVTIVTATKPRKVLKSVPQLVRFAEEASGRYRSDDKLSVRVLVVPRIAFRAEKLLAAAVCDGAKIEGNFIETGAGGMVGHRSARLPSSPKGSIGGVSDEPKVSDP